MTKEEIFKYLKSIQDKSGGFKKQESIKKNYPELYNELINSNLPDYWSFTQKLWHILQDDYEVHRCKCGKELHFVNFKKGYRKYCSKTCPYVIEHNKNTILLAQKTSTQIESRQRAIQTIKNKNGGVFWKQDDIKRLRNTYQQNKLQMCENRRNTIKKHITEMSDLTNTSIKGSSSKCEIQFYKYLISKYDYDDILPQYMDIDRYPFACDFYIKSLDLFIEINGMWTHGGHPFDENNDEDMKKLTIWRTKNTKFYNQAIYVWTDLDVRKRNIAKKNKLNYIELFSHNISELIIQFENKNIF